MNELVERNLVPLVHRLLADHAFRNIAVSLGRPRNASPKTSLRNEDKRKSSPLGVLGLLEAMSASH